MNTDIRKFINYINKGSDKVNGKRKKCDIKSEDIIDNMNYSSIEIISTISLQNPTIKGKELSSYLDTIKTNLKESINEIKNGKQINDSETMVKLNMIAILSNTIDIIEEIESYVSSNRAKTLADCIKFIRKQYNLDMKEPSNKKMKIFVEVENHEEAEEYEEESNYESSDEEDEDYGDNDDDDDDEEEEEEEEEPKRENEELFKLIYKSRDNDDEISDYYSKLSTKEKQDTIDMITEVKNYQNGTKPVLFQIMEMPLQMNQKNQILKNYTTLTSSRFPDNKLRNWFDSLMTIPFGKYKGINMDSIKSTKVKPFLDNLQQLMDNAVYGHDEAKRQIIQMMGQQIRNPKAKGSMLGIWGPMGNGKTTLIKEGIAKAMDKPFVFISLGGATDSSFLEGHSYTYEGSIYGRIANGLISSKCMDPIIYFDELDKISKSHKGEEITNILIHLTDPAQNSHFRDKYFHGIDIDLSRATMIFSFNDPCNVNPILLDRITTVETKYLLTNQKVHIAQNYLLKDMIKEMGLNDDDITINTDTLKDIIVKYTREGGVRKMKSLMYNMVRELNLANLLKTQVNGDKVKFPFNVETKHLQVLLKNKNQVEPEKIHKESKSGIINGLWASENGTGGVLSLQAMWLPSQTALSIKATGNLEKVIKESTEVACSLAWNHLSSHLKDKYMTEWKDKPMGFHIHCPDGSTPKDGPSAGTALTVCIISMLTNRKIKNDVAITGEINLQGNVTAIGGLENKLEGAKRAGVTLALYPKENEKDIVKIKERNPTLIDETFKVMAVETLDEAINLALI